MTAKGTIAAGHPETVGAAAAILDDGGNAFDAVLAAIFAACVVEPVLASLGGGGFLVARPVGDGAREPVLYDFFTQTPKRRPPAGNVDFYPIDADFGTVTQEFHIGMGSIATPGTVKGLFRVHEELCTLPMSRIVEPAVRLGRRGFTVNRLQAYLFGVVGPIYMSSARSREIFASEGDPDNLRHEGERMANPAFADALEALAREGEDLFYRGEIAARIAEDCRTGGGTLAADDLAGYRVERRRPLGVDYRGTRLHTNPPPSTGGILIAFALELLKEVQIGALRFGSAEHLERLAQAMALTNKARVESGLHEADEDGARETLLDPGFLAAYRAEILGRPRASRGTTHVSVIDAAGNAAALTLSNGEGCGYIVPDTGIMLNNMLGEEDIHPLGFHRWPTDARICSMMAPTLAVEADGRVTALGSGGSNRLRTAILQVLVNLLDFGLGVADAVEAPRIHIEGGRLSTEPGFDERALEPLIAGFEETQLWEEKNLFFGGVHAARFDARTEAFDGGGDPRRGGATRTV
ncbi:MAG: gamma-glutamyltransferase [Rhodospirillales bacterium]